MLFNSLQFVVFFVIVFSLYLAIHHRWQNRMLLVASYFFYGAWDWRFLFLIFMSTTLDYFCGLRIQEAKNLHTRKLFLAVSISGNLCILGFFKYFNFFVSSLQVLLGYFGLSIQPQFLHIILPVGISFYTFQTMSYTIDIYRYQIKPEKSLLKFSTFVAFFPQLVAGPILRAREIIPQFKEPQRFNWGNIGYGVKRIIYGLFLKVVLADNIAPLVDSGFSLPIGSISALDVWALAFLFGFQIYFDFSAYSHIAIGSARLMGIHFLENFSLY